MTITVRHFDCAGTRNHVDAYATTEPADGEQRKFLDVLDAALHGRSKGQARDFSGFTSDQKSVIAQADLVGFAGGPADREAFMKKHADVIALGANMAIENNSLPNDPADREAYDEDEQEISIRADLPKAGSAGVTDGENSMRTDEYNRNMGSIDKPVTVAAAAKRARDNTATRAASTEIRIAAMNSEAAKFWAPSK
jgi:hypothetical protein